jgi:hypothetical protein
MSGDDGNEGYKDEDREAHDSFDLSVKGIADSLVLEGKQMVVTD